MARVSNWAWSLQHKFIIVATDFFTKWVEPEPLKEASGATIRQFIFYNIICRFGIPEVLVSDRGAAFMGGDVEKLVNDYGIQFIHSTPYYAQSNGKAEASKKIIITLLKKLLVENPHQWHETLYKTLRAYCTSKRNPTATTPYALMFSHYAVLPLEVNVQSLRVQDQLHLISEDYVQGMWQEHEDLSDKRLEALDSFQRLDVSPKEETTAYLTFVIPHNREGILAKFFAELQDQEDEFGIADIQLGLATLEEVFLNIARRAELESATAEGRLVTLTLTSGVLVQIPTGTRFVGIPGTVSSQNPNGLMVEVFWEQDESCALRISDHSPETPIPPNIAVELMPPSISPRNLFGRSKPVNGIVLDSDQITSSYGLNGHTGNWRRT